MHSVLIGLSLYVTDLSGNWQRSSETEPGKFAIWSTPHRKPSWMQLNPPQKHLHWEVMLRYTCKQLCLWLSALVAFWVTLLWSPSWPSTTNFTNRLITSLEAWHLQIFLQEPSTFRFTSRPRSLRSGTCQLRGAGGMRRLFHWVSTPPSWHSVWWV